MDKLQSFRIAIDTEVLNPHLIINRFMIYNTTNNVRMCIYAYGGRYEDKLAMINTVSISFHEICKNYIGSLMFDIVANKKYKTRIPRIIKQ